MITLWHNPRCSKSRQTLALIEESGTPVTPRRYLEDTPDAETLRAARDALGLASFAEMMRLKEPAARALALGPDSDEKTLLNALLAEPKLIERPIAFAPDGRAVIGRPPEAVKALL